MSKAETCVCCGRVIPENSHYCVICGMGIPKKQRQIDRIRNMSVEELAEFISNNYRCKRCAFNDEFDMSCSGECREGIKQYLESEATE